MATKIRRKVKEKEQEENSGKEEGRELIIKRRGMEERTGETIIKKR